MAKKEANFDLYIHQLLCEAGIKADTQGSNNVDQETDFLGRGGAGSSILMLYNADINKYSGFANKIFEEKDNEYMKKCSEVKEQGEADTPQGSP